MSDQLIIREIPEKFIKGLMDGTLKEYGGVIRDLSGKIQGHLLFKNAEAIEHVSKQLTQISGQIGQASQHLNILQGLQTATIAMQGLNLGVSIVGFAIVCHKLNTMSEHMVAMDRKLDLILDAHTRAEWKLELGRQARLNANLRNLDSGLRTRDDVRVGDAMNRIAESAQFYRVLGDALCIDPSLAFRSADVVHHALTTASASNLALAHAHAIRGNVDEALVETLALSDWQSNISRKLFEPFQAEIPPAWLGRSEIQIAKPQWQPMLNYQRNAPEGIAYAKNIYELCTEQDLKMNTLCNLTSDEHPFACIPAS